MYLVSVILLTAVLPLASIYAQFSFASTPQSLMLIVGIWFVFWCAGVRLFVDGALQYFRPRFTSEEIIGIQCEEVLPVVRELGATNLAIGLLAMTSIFVPMFVLPSAIVGAIVYGVAGSRHATASGRSGSETAAMVSDLAVSSVLALYAVYAALGMLLGRL
jgi:hypothetical protein